MSTSPNAVTTLIAGAIVAAIAVVCMAVLTWHGSVTGQEFTTFLSTLTLTGVVGGVGHAAVKAGAKASVIGATSPALAKAEAEQETKTK